MTTDPSRHHPPTDGTSTSPALSTSTSPSVTALPPPPASGAPGGFARWRLLFVVLLAGALPLAWIVLREYRLLRDGVPAILAERPAASVALADRADRAVSTVFFVPVCAQAVAVRFDPGTSSRGDVDAAFFLNQTGNTYPGAPDFDTSVHLDGLRDGIWQVPLPDPRWRGRFVKIVLTAPAPVSATGPGAEGANVKVQTRAARAAGTSRPHLDDRWMRRTSVIAGAVTTETDPLRCIASSEAMPRWLRVPAAWFFAAFWSLVAGCAVWWIWPSGIARTPVRTDMRSDAETRPHTDTFADEGRDA